MAYEEPNRLVEWYQAIPEQLLAMRKRFGEWWELVREEPSRSGETTVSRYSVDGLGAMFTLWCVIFAIELITPPPPADARPGATTADFHVVCDDAMCCKSARPAFWAAAYRFHKF